jgi:hypothetical protein
MKIILNIIKKLVLISLPSINNLNNNNIIKILYIIILLFYGLLFLIIDIQLIGSVIFNFVKVNIAESNVLIIIKLYTQNLKISDQLLNLNLCTIIPLTKTKILINNTEKRIVV